MRLLFCALVFAAILTGGAHAALPGEFDYSFGPSEGLSGTRSGRVRTSFAPGETAVAKALAVQPDGRIVVAGRTMRPGVVADTALMRTLPDGTLDGSFGVTGMMTAGLPAANEAAALALLPDGKIITAGPSTRFHPLGFILMRFHSNGLLDTSFGTDGAAEAGHPESAPGRVIAVNVLSDGGLLLLTRDGGGFQLIRLRQSGARDPGFNGGAPVRVAGVLPAALVAMPDGRILVAGSDQPDNLGRFWVGRFLPDGRPDASFGGTGNVRTAFATGAQLRALRLEPNGTMLAAGTLLLPAAGEYIFAAARYLPGGTLDPSFHGTGKLTGDVVSLEPEITAIAPDGKVFISGFFEDRIATVVRFLPDGSPDYQFNDTIRSQFPPFDDQVNLRTIQAILPLNNGRFLTAGDSRGMLDVIRYFSEEQHGTFAVEDAAGPAVVSGEAVDLGEVAAGTEVIRSFNLRNTGPGQLTVMRVEQRLNDGNAFSQIDAVPSIMIANASSPFRIRFTPAALEAFEVEYRFFSGSLPGNFFSLHLKGRGAAHAPRVSLSAPGLAEPLVPGVTVPLGTAARGSGVTRQFIVKNTGNAPLTIYGIDFEDEAGAEDFSSSSLAETTLPAGGLTVFTVTFRPSSGGLRTARLLLSTSAVADRLFPVNLEGRGLSLLESWRQRYFGDPENSGTGADTEDADGDGNPNFLEFATLTDPRRPDAFPGMLTLHDGLMEYSLDCPAGAATEVDYIFEWSGIPSGPWSTEGTAQTVASLPDQRQRMTFTAPAGETGRRFARVRIVRRAAGSP